MTPTPLEPHDRRLRAGRYEVDIIERHTTRRGAYMVTATGRFTNLTDAKRWADERYGEAFGVDVTMYSARIKDTRGNWEPTISARRRDGAWT